MLEGLAEETRKSIEQLKERETEIQKQVSRDEIALGEKKVQVNTRKKKMVFLLAAPPHGNRRQPSVGSSDDAYSLGSRGVSSEGEGQGEASRILRQTGHF